MDLQQVHNKIKEFVEHQERELRIKIVDEKIRIWIDLDGQFYDQVINKVSRFALMEVYHMVCTGFKAISAMCRGQIKATLGLPCPHHLRARVAAHGTLQLNDFHAQWHLDPPLPLRFPPLHSDQVEEENAPPSGLITLLNSVAEVYPTLDTNQQAET